MELWKAARHTQAVAAADSMPKPAGAGGERQQGKGMGGPAAVHGCATADASHALGQTTFAQRTAGFPHAQRAACAPRAALLPLPALQHPCRYLVGLAHGMPAASTAASQPPLGPPCMENTAAIMAPRVLLVAYSLVMTALSG